MHKVAVFTTKGGAGKSAVTVFLADFLSTAFEKRVLVVDLDPQQSSAVSLLGDDRVFQGFEQGKSLPLLLRQVMRGQVKADDAREMLIERHAVQGRGKHRYLRSLDVMACERESWRDLNDDLMEHRRNIRAYYGLVNDALNPLRGDYDVCLIDFPAHDTGPIVRAGLRTADWWLFPVTPDRQGTRDVAASVEAVHEVSQYDGHELKGLGTLLNIAQVRSGTEYRFSKSALQRLADQHAIPPLFPRDAEISFSTDAKNALDDTFLEKYRTLDMRYGGTAKPLYKSLRTLAKEVLSRLSVPYQQAESVRFIDRLNRVLTGLWG